MPTDPAARRLAWADALDALRDCLHDPATRLTAARQVLAVEMARMRHGRPVTGTEPPRDDDPPRGFGLPPDVVAW